jgi:hypothetical protein
MFGEFEGVEEFHAKSANRPATQVTDNYLSTKHNSPFS